MTVTMKKVARRAGVSVSTVSRVLSGHPHVREELSRKVRRTMEELGYTPNLIAKSLVSRSARCLCILLPGPAAQMFSNLYFLELIRGIAAGAGRLGFDVVLSSGATEQEELEAVSGLLKGGRVDGAVLLSSRTDDAVIAYLKSSGHPFVLIGRSEQYDGILTVETNQSAAACDATRHLISMGHERIGFIGSPPDSTAARDRLEGYRRALREYGLECHPDWMIGDGAWKDGGAMSSFMKLPDRPTALVAADDMVSFGVIRSLGQLNYGVPGDLALVSCSNAPLPVLSVPSISSIDTGIGQLGETASRVLIRSIQQPHQGKPVSGRFIVGHRLIVRESSRLGLSV
ncbi:LacI family DNA-binding transcriptional regulator [Paenibacillus sp. S150]|uniref:LacI family DNA-binding transcriptional regulator n=1 Tax=Paenibacillus sp. S150 TaxID=2749826 RepID=UPI001C599DC4|nr:LacI family DNA-binding transcriptional regulator [Paenibacillus sp. S150]MBW4085735.1 LacI family DNA-binding transcriptional regulator [Paenibacillus sp. S150]